MTTRKQAVVSAEPVPPHSLALEHAVRPLMTYLHAVVAPTAVYAAPEDRAGGSTGVPALDRRIARASGELADPVATRPAAAAADPFDEPVPFAQLLRGQ